MMLGHCKIPGPLKRSNRLGTPSELEGTFPDEDLHHHPVRLFPQRHPEMFLGLVVAPQIEQRLAQTEASELVLRKTLHHLTMTLEGIHAV